ncbi:MAG: hypothetical protein AAGJ40_10215, partial [Planctomycetota bacterium]
MVSVPETIRRRAEKWLPSDGMNTLKEGLARLLACLFLVLTTICGHCLAQAEVGRQATANSPRDPRSSEPDSRSTPIRIVAWNVESGGNDPGVIALQLKQFGPCDVFALSEVSPRSFERYATALGNNYQSIATKSGGGDRLQVLFRSDRFELIRSIELNQEGTFRLNDGNHRSPLLVHLRDR